MHSRRGHQDHRTAAEGLAWQGETGHREGQSGAPPALPIVSWDSPDWPAGSSRALGMQHVPSLFTDEESGTICV